MIPQPIITAWRNRAPWAEFAQVEQDLVLTRAVIEIYSDPLLSSMFAFRGGTAMQKLFSLHRFAIPKTSIWFRQKGGQSVLPSMPYENISTPGWESLGATERRVELP